VISPVLYLGELHLSTNPLIGLALVRIPQEVPLTDLRMGIPFICLCFICLPFDELCSNDSQLLFGIYSAVCYLMTPVGVLSDMGAKRKSFHGVGLEIGVTILLLSQHYSAPILHSTIQVNCFGTAVLTSANVILIF
jgi:hypothetical protein